MIRWKLTKKLAGYIERNKRLSPLNSLEHRLLTQIYQYLTKQKTGPAFKEELYNTYTELINRCYGINQAEINQEILTMVKIQMQILLDRDYNSNASFIILNNTKHYDLMNQVIEVFIAFSTDDYYGYASQEEFYNTLDLYRKRFHQLNLTTDVIATAVGKSPKKLMKRFNHENVQ